MFTQATRDAVRPYVPGAILAARRKVLNFRRDVPLLRLNYISRHTFSLAQRSDLVRRLRLIQNNIACVHTHAEMQSVIDAILEIPISAPGCIVEAGCYKAAAPRS